MNPEIANVQDVLPAHTQSKIIPPKLTLAEQVERLESRAEKLNEALGETIATVLLSLETGYIRASDQQAEKNLRAFLENRSELREQLMSSND